MYEEIVCKGENKACIICGGRNPTWGCYPFGVLCCTKCSGSFRDMGTSVCLVKSFLLDNVSEEYMAPFLKGGNACFAEWHEQNVQEELTPQFFETPKAKEYLAFLEKSAPPSSIPRAPIIKASFKKQHSRLKIASSPGSFVQTEKLPEELPKKDSLSSHQPNANQPVEIKRIKKSVRRAPGSIMAEEQDTSRLGMFKNVQEVSTTAPNIKAGSVSGSTLSSSTPPPDIVVGPTFIGSADIPQKSMTDKIKKGLEKGKKTILNTFEKAHKKYTANK